MFSTFQHDLFVSKTEYRKYFVVSRPLVSPAVAIFGWWINQIWFQSDFQLFKWGDFTFWAILQLDLWWPLTLLWPLTAWTCKGSHNVWPWHMTSDLINKSPSVASMAQLCLKSIKARGSLEPNVNPFSTDNNRLQTTKWFLFVFPAKAGDTKSKQLV